MAKTDTTPKQEGNTEQNSPIDQTSVAVDKKKCGIIMPISGDKDTNSVYTEKHWSDVLEIITEAFSDTDFETNLVSVKNSVGIIHESIVNNIYDNEIVICDVSNKNPNVMFELGLRLAFDKPVIIIKDDKTDYVFDVGPIHHIQYPSSLRFKDIIRFQEELRDKAIATYKLSKEDSNYSPFLKSFKKSIVSGKIENVEIKDFQDLVNKMNTINSNVNNIRNSLVHSSANSKNQNRSNFEEMYDQFYKDNQLELDEIYFKLGTFYGKKLTSEIFVEEALKELKNKYRSLAYDTVKKLLQRYYLNASF